MNIRRAHAATLTAAATDLELAEHAASGDERAFEIIMRRNNRALYRAARSILRDDAEAEDAVQEAYMQAFRAIGTFSGGSRLATWLTRIVINEALQKMRKRKQESGTISIENVVNLEAHLSEATGEPDSPERAAVRAQTRRLIEQKIDQLPDAFRTVFVLRALEEMSVEETAACLGLPDATVRTRYFRARGLLREALAREIDGVFEDAFAFAGERCDRIVASVLARIRAARA